MGADPDRERIARFRAGDAGAFDELVREHQASLRRLARRYVKNDEDAKDVAQRAFIRAFEKLDAFRGDASFRSWLYRIAVNLALNHLRDAKASAADVFPEDVVAFTHSLATSKLVAAEVWRKVGARLETLPPMQRLVVELRLFHELSFKEVAAITDSTEDSAKASYHYGVKRLRSVASES